MWYSKGEGDDAEPRVTEARYPCRRRIEHMDKFSGVLGTATYLNLALVPLRSEVQSAWGMPIIGVISELKALTD